MRNSCKLDNINIRNKLLLCIKCIIINIILYKIYFFKFFYYINNLQRRLNKSILFNKIYSNLYYLAKSGRTSKPQFNLKYKEKNYTINKKKGICLCTICKNENLYIKEYIDYYRLIGFDKIIIFDNNDINGEYIDKLLKDYILDNFVKIIDIRGLSSVQIGVYNYCYHKNKKKFDWIGFFDLDEFLYIKKNLNISNYLYNKRFEKCQSILFNWYIYDDNNLVKYDNRTLIERFKRLKYKMDKAKSIIRGNLKNLIISSVHILAININYFCNSRGNRVFPDSFLDIKNISNDLAYIKHFYTKTAEEFCVKINRGGGQNSKHKTIKTRLKLFFSINKMTKEKFELLKKCSHLNLNKLIEKN